MRWSQFYLHTTREVPADAEVTSHQLMLRSGMIRKAAAGIYSYLPYGLRALNKLTAIVRREIDAAGSSELTMPAVAPAELWEESGRWEQYGKELLRIQDRHGRDFVFGPTHEEVVTDIVRNDVRSYRQLPVSLYQIQTKFRDEIRPRFGLMRGREFIMKDAYTFHADEASLDEAYRGMHDAYCRIFEACGLDYTVVEADTGAIGGSSSHEFMVLADTGEDEVVRCAGCGYGANTEKAETGSLPAPPAANADQGPDAEAQDVATPGLATIPEVASFLGIEPSQMIKTLIYTSEEETPIVVLIRGDRTINEIKLAHALGVRFPVLADDATVKRITGAPVGFAGPVGLAEGVRVIADHSVKGMVGAVTGANQGDTHRVGVTPGRDFEPTAYADVLLAAAGDPCPRCEGTLELFRGIEVGHIFKLGTKYSEAMGCTFLDAEGKSHPMLMGCYGLGIGRTVAAAIEQNNDESGVIWPLPLAPFEVLVIALNPQDEAVVAAAEEIYQGLAEAGVEALFDDRKGRPGVKFNDADLIGVPLRVVVGKKGLAEGNIEVSRRQDREKHMIAQQGAVEHIRGMLEATTTA